MGDITEKEKRAKRGTEMIRREGTDRATGKARLFARFTVNGKRYHPRLHATNMEDARAEFAEGIKRVRAGLPFHEEPKGEEPAKITVKELADKFHKEAQADVWDLDYYRRQMFSAFSCHLIPYLGARAAQDIRRADVATWRDKLKADGRTSRQIVRALVTASRLWNWALELGHLPEETPNPIGLVSKPRLNRSTEFYTDREVKGLLGKAAEIAPGLHPIIAFAYFTGARRGEIAALQWGDVDFDAGVIYVRRSWNRNARKSGEPVTVPLHSHLRAILEPLAAPERPASAIVFPDPETGAMRKKYDHELWGLPALAKVARVRALKMPWHAFRHSHATGLAAKGATPGEIQKALGQASIEMAMRYTEISAKQVAKRVAALPALGPVKPGAKITRFTIYRTPRPISESPQPLSI